MDAKGVLEEAFGRLPELVGTAIDGLTPEQLRWAPRPGANSIGWLVWHLTRVQDSHLAEILESEQVYVTGDWAARFGRKPDPSDSGYGHTAADAAAVVPESAAALTEYYRAVHARTVDFVKGLTEADLDRIVDRRWDPPVTLGARLVSVYDDDAQHAGQAAYLRGLLPE
ncbi:DinB family protein [Actinoplanes sp. NPDC020271]|uniref:mycothiol transferase n=1 Tax=Actinoplanes sp. NPDC020271 TaxID=3363896 RepID=UPI0037AAFB06